MNGIISFYGAFLLISLALAAPADAYTVWHGETPCNNPAPGRCYSPCDETSIAAISSDGGSIVLLKIGDDDILGNAYDVDPRDRKRVTGWNEGDDVLVCDTGRLVNKDRPDGETANVRLNPRFSHL